jgi:shikimate kinase
MAAGKSAIGRLLAERLSLPFADTDKLIEQSFGLSVAEIFDKRGEAAFRDAERTLTSRLVAGERQVIAVGGGLFTDPKNRDLLNRGARTVWLDPPFELILPRLERSAKRPLAANRSEAELRSLWDVRRKDYALARLRIRTGNTNPDQVVDQILSALESGKSSVED